MEKDNTKRKRKAEHINGEVPRKKSQVRWKMLLSLTPALIITKLRLPTRSRRFSNTYPTTFLIGSAIAHQIRLTAVEGGEEKSSERTCHCQCH